MTRARTNADQAHTESLSVEPHIIPGVLYPAVAGKLLDGSTSHSGNYGTAQSDGRSYFYTDIKGSKPIKDPRIGAHFGSQRHITKSLQKLEQETATNGTNVYSVDGRGWIRAFDTSGKWVASNDDNGQRLGSWGNTSEIASIEIVGYFNDMTITGSTETSDRRSFVTSLNGSANSSENASYKTSANTPLSSRYVDRTSLVHLNLPTTHSSTLGINTLKISNHADNDYLELSSIELIAQDTSSTANKSKIQIPSQNVVSYGKKFTVSGTPHYDPFNGFTSGTDISSYIDEATSLGMSNWKVSSTWYRPFNGGRVVIWCDSSGNLKTSVTMMPPNAQNISGTASNAIDLSSSQTNDDTINFNTSAIEHSLSEVAKTFNYREFGNGSANGGTESGSYADASMLNAVDDIAYVMDDGLTSLSGEDCTGGDRMSAAQDKAYYITFIGTGTTTYNDSGGAGHHQIAQNLPYGTHIIKFYRDSTNADPHITVDGIQFSSVNIDNYTNLVEITFHQPKKPPIPEDAVVIADYMLMADFVGVTGASGGIDVISKGTRFLTATRDVMWDESTNDSYSFTFTQPASRGGNYQSMASGNISSGEAFGKVPYFGTTVDVLPYADRFSTLTEPLNSTSITTTSVSTTTWSGRQRASGQTLGMNEIKVNKTTGNFTIQGFEIASPTHTSSHYQTFETPFLNELVGGDRNMEQTNLVVTPDGKTWDELRDTSYIGNCVIETTTDTTTDWDATVIFDEWRGVPASTDRSGSHNKDWAIAYDRMICLKGGSYTIKYTRKGDSTITVIRINGTGNNALLAYDGGDLSISSEMTRYFNRGEFFQICGEWGEGGFPSNLLQVLKN